ncbi:SRPBCC family protein [Tabrizicola thermarum]|uniref:SRPBCC family protein n=1 Tax=Tabrizicola thermarum TaxID=2670345 RepID=UPI000FFBCB37|nr:SRPBCC family protein [Tabrizicola thermarum]
MKLTAKTDLEVPAAAVFATLIDHPAWEREAIRNGVEVERPAGTPAMGVGAEWRIRGHFRGKPRKVQVRIGDLTPDQRLVLGLDSPTIEGTTWLEVMVLSPRRSRLRVDLEVKPKTLAARLFINTMRLAKGRVQARFEKGLVRLGARIKDRYDRQV